MSLRPAAPANGSPRTGSVMPGAWPMISARCPSRAHRIGGGVMRGHIRQPAIVSVQLRERADASGGMGRHPRLCYAPSEHSRTHLRRPRHLPPLPARDPGGETGEPLRGAELGNVEVHEGDMWIAAYAGEIVAVGHGYEVRDRLDLDDGAVIIDAPGLVAVPGLIDCHTHAATPAIASTSSSCGPAAPPTRRSTRAAAASSRPCARRARRRSTSS